MLAGFRFKKQAKQKPVPWPKEKYLDKERENPVLRHFGKPDRDHIYIYAQVNNIGIQTHYRTHKQNRKTCSYGVVQHFVIRWVFCGHFTREFLDDKKLQNKRKRRPLAKSRWQLP
jgi:hypothetical protein